MKNSYMLKLVWAILLFAFAFSCPAQNNLGDVVSMEAWFDGVIETRLKEDHIAGATLSVVYKGEIILQKGYGYADIENKVAVDPETTLFRIGSISKLFTWTAIMKLQEEGRLDLDDPIDKYLEDLDIPDKFNQSITIRQLMSHTPGFEDELFGLFARDESAMKPLGEILRSEMPNQVRPPGVHSSYSNHGTGMAAMIVEEITEKNFNDFVEEEILNPLRMTYATFNQPVPERLEGYLSKGHRFVNGEFISQKFEFVPLYPVGGASASSSSMARFMLMLLNHGKLDGAQIIDSTTFELMTSVSHRHHADVNPMRHGFMDMSQNGETIIGHGGDVTYHHSNLAMFPEHKLGFFISVNSEIGYPGLPNKILEEFTDRYFPEEVEGLATPRNFSLQKFEGVYAMNRYSHDDILKLAKVMAVVNVEPMDDGRLKMSFGNQPTYWEQKDDLVFRNSENSDVIVFEENEKQQITNLFIGSLPIMAFDKLGGLSTPSAQMWIALGPFAITLLALVYWLMFWFFRRAHSVERSEFSVLPQRIKRLTLMTLGLVVLFYIGFSILMSLANEIIFGVPPLGYLLFTIPIIITVLTIILLYYQYEIWKSNEGLTVGKKIAFSIICLSLVVTVLQWNYWNLLGYNF